MPTDRTALLFLSIVAFSASAIAAPGMYKWVDEDGEVVYSQFPPPDGREARTMKPPPPPAVSPAQAQQHLDQQMQRFADGREDRELAAQKSAEQEQKAGIARQRCETARRNLTGLEGRARQLFKTADGEYRRLTDEERQRKKAELQKVIAEDCR
jgi:hypothetical protein